MPYHLSTFLSDLTSDLAGLDTQMILLAVIFVTSLIALDALSRSIQRSKEAAGLGGKTVTVSMDGSRSLPVRHYVSEIQGLAGKPDAIVYENGHMIPVERKPLARKMRDRYVAQLLVYMRLIAEFEKKPPPYGYLILGPSCRKFKIENSPARQAWLQSIIDEMRAALKGTPVKPKPHPRKCRRCDVKAHCPFKDNNLAGDRKSQLTAGQVQKD